MKKHLNVIAWILFVWAILTTIYTLFGDTSYLANDEWLYSLINLGLQVYFFGVILLKKKEEK